MLGGDLGGEPDDSAAFVDGALWRDGLNWVSGSIVGWKDVTGPGNKTRGLVSQ